MFAAHLLALALTQQPAAPCLPMAGDQALTGRLVRRTFPGPPNFESVRRGDRPETYWLLRLDRPICVQADADRDVVRPIREVQLLLGAEDFVRDRRLVGHRVIARGAFMDAISGHHHTDVLLEQVTLTPAR